MIDGVRADVSFLIGVLLDKCAYARLRRTRVKFASCTTRAAGPHVQDAFGLSPPEGVVLQTDGYAVYAQYAKKSGLTHAQCWVHYLESIDD